MPILTLKINDKVYNKVLLFLNQFKKSDVEIVGGHLLKLKHEIQIDFEETIVPTAKSYTIKEVNNMAEETLAKYETTNDYSFENIKKEVEKDFEEAREPRAKFYTLEEADIILDKVIAQYENNSNE